MLLLEAWLIAFLTFSLPPDWKQTHSACETIQEPTGQAVEECFASWVYGEKELYAFVWQPQSPISRDRGPMAVAEEIKGQLLGQDITISRTSMFFGKQQEVLVAGVDTETPKGRILIYARNVSPREFQTLLNGVELARPSGN